MRELQCNLSFLATKTQRGHSRLHDHLPSSPSRKTKSLLITKVSRSSLPGRDSWKSLAFPSFQSHVPNAIRTRCSEILIGSKDKSEGVSESTAEYILPCGDTKAMQLLL